MFLISLDRGTSTSDQGRSTPDVKNKKKKSDDAQKSEAKDLKGEGVIRAFGAFSAPCALCAKGVPRPAR